MRDHSFLVYFGILERLGGVEAIGETEAPSMQDSCSLAPSRTYYRPTEDEKEAGDELWSNPLSTLYAESGPSHMKKPD